MPDFMTQTLKGYMYDDESKKFQGECDVGADPLESQLQGKFIPLVPAHCVFVAPPAKKDGFEIVWNGSAWDYQEEKKDPEPEPYVPTELDKAYDNLYSYRGKLQETDYINDKISDAINTGDETLAEQLREKYQATFAERETWREQVRYWESEVERLKAEQSTAE